MCISVRSAIPLGGLVAACLTVLPSARAQTAAADNDVALIESLAGSAASNGEVEQLAPVLGEPRALTGAALRTRIEQRLGVRPQRLEPSQLAELLGRFARAEEALFYRGAQARAALPEIEQIVERVRAVVATRAHNANARQMHRSAIVALLRAYTQQSVDPRTTSLFAELASCFPDQPIDAQRDGARLHQLYSDYLAKVRHGSIEIVSRGRGATVYLNARPIGFDRLTVPEGRYEIFAANAAGDGRVRTVEVVAGQVAKVVLSLDLDQALDAEDGAMLRFADEATQRRRDRELAEELRQLLLVKQLYLLRNRGKDTPLLVRLREDGSAERTLPAELQARLAAARELTQASASSGKIETSLDLAARPSDTQPPGSQRAVRAAAYGVYAVSMALLAGGLIADALHGAGTCLSTNRLCNDTYDSKSLGAALAGSGAGLGLMAGATLVATDALDTRHARPLRTVGILLLGAAAPAIVGGALYLRVAPTVEATTTGVQPLDRKRGSGLAAITVGAGLALSGVGLVIADALKKPLAPTAAIGRDGISVGVGGRF